MPIRIEFEKELMKLHKDIVKMGAFIEESIDDMIKALLTMDRDIARHVVKNDDLIDEMEKKIERECLIIIARQQPIATDLRDITSILKIVTDLERIADHCEDICSFIVASDKIPDYPMVEEIPDMIQGVKKMVSDTIDAYIKKDYKLAKDIIERDDIIDDQFERIVETIIESMEQDSSTCRAATYYLYIAKYLERMADHATNIAEWIVYYITGRIQ